MAISDDEGTLRDLVADRLLPLMNEEATRLDRIDRWARWDHERPHSPRHSTREYSELVDRAYTPWLGLIVDASVQALYVEGYRDGDGQNSPAWDLWQRNGFDRRQIPLHRSVVTYGSAYLVGLPGRDPLTGDPSAHLRAYSPRQMIAAYDEEELDADWPEVALRVIPRGSMEPRLKLYTSDSVISLESDGRGKLRVISRAAHATPGIVPVVRYTHRLDLEGRTTGDVEPYISVAGRIDQTIFDRLVTQRFSSWIVRTITGMSKPDTDEDEAAAKMKLRQEDILVATDPDVEFGHLPATPLDGFISAKEADIRDLAAVAQVPPHHLIGQVSNLSAEALAGAEAAHARKMTELRHNLGESHEQTMRLGSLVVGDTTTARDIHAQVQWRDVESRSLAQTADALNKLMTLQVPIHALWERIPGVTRQDVEAWKTMVEEDAFTLLARELADGIAPETGGIPGSQPLGDDVGTGLL